MPLRVCKLFCNFLIALVCSLSFIDFAHSQELSDFLSQQLLGNQYTDKTWIKREQHIRLAVAALKRQGVISTRPVMRYDYEDLYRINGSIVIKGLKPVLLSHEYMIQYGGCCVNDGIALVLEADGNTEAITSFAKKNWCNLSGYNEAADVESKLKFRKKNQSYILLSCKANDPSGFEVSKK